MSETLDLITNAIEHNEREMPAKLKAESDLSERLIQAKIDRVEAFNRAKDRVFTERASLLKSLVDHPKLTNEQIIERAAMEHETYMIQSAALGLTARSDQQADRDQQCCA